MVQAFGPQPLWPPSAAQCMQKQPDFSGTSPPAIPLGSARGAAMVSSLSLPPPPHVNGPGRVSSFERGGGGICKGGHVSSFEGGGPLTRARGAIGVNSHQNSKKNYLCTHFLACAIGVNVVRTNAWYLLHLSGGCGAHAGHLLQFFYAFTPFLLWCSTFVSHAFPSSHMQAHNSKHEENTQLQLQKK